MGVSGHGQGAQAAAMERVIHGDDLMAVIPVPVIGIAQSRFQRAFHCFRSAVGKEHLRHTGCL